MTWYAAGPGGALQLECGRLVFSCNHAETGADGFVRRATHVFLADAHGDELELRVGGVADAWTNECAVVVGADGALLLNARDLSGRCVRWTAESRDGGESFEAGVQLPALLEPSMHGCHAALARCSGEKARLCFANPASSRREALTAIWSDDDGKSWTDALLVHAGPVAYSSMQPLPEGAADSSGRDAPVGEGAIALLYECGDSGGSPYSRIDYQVVHSGSAPDAGGGQLDAAGGATQSHAGADGLYGAWG
mmetsp:Transcript_33383/g.77009  ORF Transcript_33383/g.77009 Transcript_33383/m.77009 type:complete len:251 (-) Transcript_33383:35-787(-)